VNAIWSSFLAGRARQQGATATAPVSVEMRFWYNANAISRWFLIPGSMTVIMTLLGTLLTSLVIAREYERGTLEALYATPLTRGQILIGKSLPYFLLAMVSMAVCVLTALLLFQLPLRGSFLTLGLVSAVFLVPALGQGLLISVTMKSQMAAAQLGLMTGYLPAMMLSGFLFDIRSMPGWLQAITYLIPARYMNVSLQTVFLAGDIWAVLLPNMLFMIAVGAAFFGLTWQRLHKRVD
jgi:ABC-2 type transport system permease protein